MLFCFRYLTINKDIRALCAGAIDGGPDRLHVGTPSELLCYDVEVRVVLQPLSQAVYCVSKRTMLSWKRWAAQIVP
jgi:ciliary BBSome complex subunit 2-like protein